MDFLWNLNQKEGKTVIIVTHELESLGLCKKSNSYKRW